MAVSPLDLNFGSGSNTDSGDDLASAMDKIQAFSTAVVTALSEGGDGGGAVASVAGKTGVVTLDAGDIEGLAASATTDATDADNISSGTLVDARLSSATTTSLGKANTAEQAANKGANSGYAPLDSSAKVPLANIPASVQGGLNYQGVWNASTNSPTLVSSTGTKGFFYKVSVAGTTAIDGNSQWNVGDSLVFDGTTWDKLDGIASEIVSVAGKTGVVTLASTDISGLAASATTDTTQAGNISGGTLPDARLSSPTTTSLGLANTAEQVANKGANSGYAPLDSSAKVPLANIPASVQGGLNYQGVWNASTNSPTLVSSTGTKGFFYKVSVAGTTAIDGNSQWNVGDSLVFDGTTWDKLDGISNEIVSVAGKTGVVTLAAGDISSGTFSASLMPALTGDVTTTVDTVATTIAANAVTNAKAAQMAAGTIKGNNGGSLANASDLTVAQIISMLGIGTTNPIAVSYFGAI